METVNVLASMAKLSRSVLVTVQDVWWLISVCVHYLGESAISPRVDISAVAVAMFALAWAEKKRTRFRTRRIRR